MSQPHPHFGNCWTHLDHFPKFIYWIPYLVSKLGKSGVHIFKRCSIWIWNGKVMAVWRWLCKPWAEMSHLHFATVGHIFEALPGAQIMHTISCFKYWEIRSPALQTVCDLEVKWRSYGRLKTSAQSWAGISQPRHHLEGCFAAVKPLLAHECHFAAQFPSFWSCDTAAKSPLSCETTFWHMRAISKPRTLILQLRNGLRNQFWAAKSLLSSEITFEQRNGYEMTSKLQNGLQIMKLTCEMEEGLQKHLAKPREIAKNANRASQSCIWRGEPRTPWDHTHQASHSIFNLLKPSEPIAPIEETMPCKETARIEAKVLVQPTQEATTDASAPRDLTITWSSLYFCLYILY